MHSGKT